MRNVVSLAVALSLCRFLQGFQDATSLCFWPARKKLADQTDQVDAESHRTLGEELDLEEQQICRALGEGA